MDIYPQIEAYFLHEYVKIVLWKILRDVPAYDGHCTVFVSVGKVSIANPEYFVIEAGWLFLLATPEPTDKLKLDSNVPSTDDSIWPSPNDEVKLKEHL